MKSMRQIELVKLLEKNHVINTAEMAKRFNVSIETIRRDLDHFEQQGILKKIYGGAELRYNDEAVFTSPLEQRINSQHSEKTSMARKAAQLIPDGCTVALDSGSTILELSKLLKEKHNMIIIASDIHSASELIATDNNNKVYIIGGQLTKDGTSSASFVKEFLASINHIDYFVLSCDGASPDDGLSNDDEFINELKRKYLKKADKSIALIDHTKFLRRGFYRLCDISELSVVITDSETHPVTVERLRHTGTKVEIVK